MRPTRTRRPSTVSPATTRAPVAACSSMRNIGFDRAAGARRLLALVLLLIPMRGIAQSTPQAGAALQVPVLLKVLTYDRHFETKAGPAVVVGIVYVAGDQASLKAAEDVGTTFFGFKGKTLKKVPVN